METLVPFDSFSQLHSYSYSVIALQMLNLNYYYPQVYWNCACLTVEAQCDEGSTKGGVDYGKIARAIYKMKNYGVQVLSPDINDSNLGFTPIERDSTIKFGLAGVSGINQDITKEIIEGRPYTSFKQFYNYHKELKVWTGEIDEDGNKIYRNSLVTKSKMISLIKAGCFDFDTKNRVNLMKWLAAWETPTKTELALANVPKCIELGVSIPNEIIKPYKFKKYALSKQFFYCNNENAKSKKDYILDAYSRDYFEKNYMDKLKEEVDYYYVGDDIIVIDKSLEKAMKSEIEKLKEYLSRESVIKEFNTNSMKATYKAMIEIEDVNRWAMESISFYDRNHELEYANLEDYNVTSFNDLPYEAEFELKKKGKREWRQYKLSRIAGTIIDCDHNKNILSLLTIDGVVNVRFNKGQYAHYKQNISEVIDGKKVTLEKPFFARGNMILVSGYRREDEFVAKKYAKSIYQHTVCLIEKINEDGSLDLKLERYNPNEE